MAMIFTDRIDVGRRLSARLSHLPTRDLIVLGLPKGGVPVAFAVAQHLTVPLDIVMVRNLVSPFRSEQVLGAIGEDNIRVINQEAVRQEKTSEHVLTAVEHHERMELEWRAEWFRGGRKPLSLQDKTAVVVDDGFAPVTTVQAACRIVRARGAKRVVLAVPVIFPELTTRLSEEADELICLWVPVQPCLIRQCYVDFEDISDEEVIKYLAQATQPPLTAETMSEARQ